MSHLELRNVDVIVLDIEGTTTPISFVHDVLFPYARDAFPDFLEGRWDDPLVQSDIALLKEQHQHDSEEGIAGLPSLSISSEEEAYREELLGYVRWLMTNDRKVTGLKALQGKIWQEGYQKGELLGQVFDDVPGVFKQLHEAHRPMYIYSSGSVQAQKLLFGQTASGDLLPYLCGHFDTKIGSKKEAESYQRIAEEIGVMPERLLFLTDILAEAEAARGAGWQAVLMDRPGNHPQPAHDFPVWQDLMPLVS
jgi:2,3-diketo-5-methylthio-1-phosphopentane phosphatase